MVAAFVTLTDMLAQDRKVEAAMGVLTDSLVALLDVDAAGLVLVDDAGGLEVVEASPPSATALQEVQVQSGQGPCLDCLSSATTVVALDLDQEHERWPAFGEAALAAGYRAASAIPLQRSGKQFGALNLLGVQPWTLRVQDQQVAQALADVAVIVLQQRRTVEGSARLAGQLQGALTSRIVIEQAKGVLAERLGIDVEAAYARLRKHARDHNLRFADVARAVVAGELVVEEQRDGRQRDR